MLLSRAAGPSAQYFHRGTWVRNFNKAFRVIKSYRRNQICNQIPSSCPSLGDPVVVGALHFYTMKSAVFGFLHHVLPLRQPPVKSNGWIFFLWWSSPFVSIKKSLPTSNFSPNSFLLGSLLEKKAGRDMLWPHPRSLPVLCPPCVRHVSASCLQTLHAMCSPCVHFGRASNLVCHVSALHFVGHHVSAKALALLWVLPALGLL